MTFPSSSSNTLLSGLTVHYFAGYIQDALMTRNDKLPKSMYSRQIHKLNSDPNASMIQIIR
jgi:hypothetical protein